MIMHVVVLQSLQMFVELSQIAIVLIDFYASNSLYNADCDTGNGLP